MTLNRRQAPRGPSRNRLLTIVIAFIIVVVTALAAVWLLSSVLNILNPYVPTAAMLPSATSPADDTATALAQITTTATATQTPEFGVLPPTWTPTDTLQPSPSATITVTQSTFTPAPTLDPAQLGDTYWDGDGTGSMWDFQLPDGSYPRFALFPVNFFVQPYGDITLTVEHEQAIRNAVTQINQVVPLVRVDNRIYAHITLWLMTDEEFNQHVQCDYVDMTVGCAETIFTDAGVLLVTIWLRVTDECFAETLLHELTHALGIGVHSPYPEDVMYAFQTCNAPQYSARDLATLRTLYSAPAYNPRGS